MSCCLGSAVGWCDGMDVKPWVVDVTAAVLGGGLEGVPGGPGEGRAAEWNTVSYRALMADESGSWVEPPASQSGYFIVSSNLIYYTAVEESFPSLLLLSKAMIFMASGLKFLAAGIVLTGCVCCAGCVGMVALCVWASRPKGTADRQNRSGVELQMVPPALPRGRQGHQLLPTSEHGLAKGLTVHEEDYEDGRSFEEQRSQLVNPLHLS